MIWIEGTEELDWLTRLLIVYFSHFLPVLHFNLFDYNTQLLAANLVRFSIMLFIKYAGS